MDKKHNILLLTARSDIGGGPKYVRDLALGLSRHQDVNLFIGAPSNGLFTPEYKELSQLFFELPFRAFSISRYIKLIIFCFANNINTVHSNGRGAGVYSRLLRPFGFKVIHTFHGVHLPKNLKEKLIIKIESILLYLTTKTIHVSKSEQQTALKLGVSNIQKSNIISNGLNTDELNNQLSESDTYTKESGKLRLGVISRLDPHKNNLQLIEYIEKFRSENNNFELYIAGDGEEEDLIKNKIKKLDLADNITLLGNIDRPFQLISEIDILLSFSKGEGLPYTILEALFANKKILISNVPGHDELASEANLFELGNYEEFKTKLVNLINSKEEKNLLPKIYSIETNLKEVLGLY